MLINEDGDGNVVDDYEYDGDDDYNKSSGNSNNDNNYSNNKYQECACSNNTDGVSFINSLIHSSDLYRSSSRDYYSVALPAQAWTKMA